MCFNLIKMKEKIYYVQFIIAGTGDVGPSVSVSTLASLSKKSVFIRPLANIERLTKQEEKKHNFQSKYDRQCKSNNSNKYNENGTVKKCLELTHRRSKNMLKTLYCIKNICRVITTENVQYQYKLANETLAMGNVINIEGMSML